VKTPVTDLLDTIGVEYELKRHEEEALTAETAAKQRGIRVSQVVKCMIGSTGDQLVVMLIPGDKKLKSSKARKYIGAPTLDLVPADRLRAEYGLTVGAIAPLQLIGQARILMDPSVLDESYVDISSGDPMAGVELKSSDLRDLLGAEIVAMISTSGNE
jgi:prolyl-tRNA editing enzyme YbaK/EbsC (Cys-tRNA(Pro) deacylase)